MARVVSGSKGAPIGKLVSVADPAARFGPVIGNGPVPVVHLLLGVKVSPPIISHARSPRLAELTVRLFRSLLVTLSSRYVRPVSRRTFTPTFRR